MIDTVDILSRFNAITLDEMDAVKLMNRVDTKYLMTEWHLPLFLQKCISSYRVLSVDNHRLTDYSSLYFDTADRSMYLRHLYGRKTRQKVRTRQYLTSGDTFLEIKRKNNHGRTKKKRIQIPKDDFANFAGNEKATLFLAEKSWYKAENLQPALNVTFQRITLVNNDKTERMTIDRNLVFNDTLSLDGIVIVEVKQSGFAMTSARESLRDLHVHPFRVSKYCIGTAMTNSSLPHNRFNEKLRFIQKLQSQWKKSQNLTPQ